MDGLPFQIDIIPLTIVLRAAQEAVLPPFLGSALHGVIGQTLRERCRDAFRYFYQNQEDGVGAQDITKPYVLEPPLAEKTDYEAGESIRFNMLLMGEAAPHIQGLLEALKGIEALGLGANRNRFELRQVWHSEHKRYVWVNHQFYAPAVRSAPLPCVRLDHVTGCVLNFVTPLRIRRDGEILRQMDAPTLVRGITSRVAQVCERYGEGSDREEAARLCGDSGALEIEDYRLVWKDLNRYSNRTQGKMNFGGLVGSIRLSGDLTALVPWICAAQTLHMGKNTTFGLGRFKAMFW
jgi:hypothetical protein